MRFSRYDLSRFNRYDPRCYSRDTARAPHRTSPPRPAGLRGTTKDTNLKHLVSRDEANDGGPAHTEREPWITENKVAHLASGTISRPMGEALHLWNAGSQLRSQLAGLMACLQSRALASGTGLPVRSVSERHVRDVLFARAGSRLVCWGCHRREKCIHARSKMAASYFGGVDCRRHSDSVSHLRCRRPSEVRLVTVVWGCWPSRQITLSITAFQQGISG